VAGTVAGLGHHTGLASDDDQDDPLPQRMLELPPRTKFGVAPDPDDPPEFVPPPEPDLDPTES
jgi:hypothetical protein